MLRPQLACFLLIVITASIVGSPTGNDEITPSCRIPNELDEGSCVEPKTCPAFQEINHVELMANASRLSFVRELQCEVDQQVGICCPGNGGSYHQPWISTGVKPRDRFDLRTRTSLSGDEDDNECGIEPFRYRVVQSNITDIDEFPWAALLLYRVDTSRCGGVLISRNFVLTAAHCLTGRNYEQNGPLKFVRLREYNLLSELDCLVDTENMDCIFDGKIDKPPKLITVHPGYDEHVVPPHHDVGLITIELTEKFDDFLRPICLPEAGRLTGLERGNILTVCGWGRTNFFKDKRRYVSSPIKMKASLPYVDPRECQEFYAKQQLISGQICAGGRTKDSCAGDSGSPLMFYDRYKGVWVLSGIVSSGPQQCGTFSIPGIYTSVVKYLPWIKSLTDGRNETLKSQRRAG